jgi:hypothetical protein
LNFTASADGEVSEGHIFSAVLSQPKQSIAVDPLLAGDEAEEEESEHDEEVKFEITDATTAAITVNQTQYELNFGPLQHGVVGSITPNAKFFFTNKDHFILIVSTVQDGNQVEQVWVGERIVAQQQASFLSKYGPSLMIGLFIFGSKLFQRQAPQPAVATAPQ